MEKKNVYLAGIYARLSVNHPNQKKESIETQIKIAKQWIEQHKEITLYDCYIDIGKTGTNFKRQNFERMLCDGKAGKINCIVVKDFSRFGRDHIELGNYLEKIFPLLGIRFISVTDGFDSIKVLEQEKIWNIALKNLFHEMYAKDISERVSFQKSIKWEQGNFMGSMPPYGYEIVKIEEKRSLFPKQPAEGIVKQIFELFLSGKKKSQIAAWLYEEKIVTPREYQKTGKVYDKMGNHLKPWSIKTIEKILKNPVYIGCAIHKKPDGTKEVRKNVYKAIVDNQIFEKTQKRLELEKTPKRMIAKKDANLPVEQCLVCERCEKEKFLPFVSEKKKSEQYFDFVMDREERRDNSENSLFEIN